MNLTISDCDGFYETGGDLNVWAVCNGCTNMQCLPDFDEDDKGDMRHEDVIVYSLPVLGR